MSTHFLALTPVLEEYIHAHSTGRDALLEELAAETAQLGGIRVMQIGALQGSLMGLLVRAIGARRAVEVGTFTGYSSLCVARALPADGKLLACDVSEEWTRIARRYWQRAGVADKIDLRLGPALETLRALPQTPQFDFGFIDADKDNQLNYYEEIVPRLRPDGLLLIDNVLWSGAVADPKDQEHDTVAVRRLNDALPGDARVQVVMLPVADGLTIVRKRAAGE